MIPCFPHFVNTNCKISHKNLGLLSPFSAAAPASIFRFYKRREPLARTRAVTYEVQKPSRVFVDAVRSGLVGIGNISAFVIFFAVAINLLFASGALGASP